MEQQITIVTEFATLIFMMAFFHFVSDFYHQKREIAENKGKDTKVLFVHVNNYMMWMSLFTSILLLLDGIWQKFGMSTLMYFFAWVVVNYVLHLVTDYFSSRASAKAYSEGNIHKFFCIIGFDQFIHISSLIFTTLFFLTPLYIITNQ